MPKIEAAVRAEVTVEAVEDLVEVVADVVQAARVEDGRGGGQHAMLIRPAIAHRDHDVDQFEAEDLRARPGRGADDPASG